MSLTNQDVDYTPETTANVGLSGVSVVIPYCNREQYIDEAIQSVLAQTLRPLEIIIVNDCSRESSRRYLDRYAEICTIVDLPVKMGLSAARNEGIRRARGEFIAFLDDDDIWEPTKLELQIQYLGVHPGCAAVQTAVCAFYADGSERIFDQKPSPLTLLHALQPLGELLPSSLLIRADVARNLDGFDRRFCGTEDHELSIRCAAAGYRIETIQRPLTRLRRQGHASLTKRNWQMYFAHVRMYWKHRALYHRVYGWRGSVSFLFSSMEHDLRNVRHLGGGIRLLVRLIPMKWEVRPDYQEPVR